MIGILRAFDGDGFLAFDNSQGDLSAAPGFVDAVDVHKSWHALSILTAPGEPTPEMTQADPLDPVLGGTAFGEDNGYGEPRYFAPDQVRTIASEILVRSDDDARARFDPEAWTAAAVYPFGWDEDLEELWQRDLLPNLVAVRAFYARAALAGHYVVLEIE